jgi:hypothetical protein
MPASSMPGGHAFVAQRSRRQKQPPAGDHLIRRPKMLERVVGDRPMLSVTPGPAMDAVDAAEDRVVALGWRSMPQSFLSLSASRQRLASRWCWAEPVARPYRRSACHP